MGDKDKKDRTGTDSEAKVMDEMDDLEATEEMVGIEDLPDDDDATAVLKSTHRQKATGDDSS